MSVKWTNAASVLNKDNQCQNILIWNWWLLSANKHPHRLQFSITKHQIDANIMITWMGMIIWFMNALIAMLLEYSWYFSVLSLYYLPLAKVGTETRVPNHNQLPGPDYPKVMAYIWLTALVESFDEMVLIHIALPGWYLHKWYLCLYV